MELYEDTAENIIRFAVPYQSHTSNSKWIKVAIFDIDSASGAVLPGTRQDVELKNSSSGDQSFIHGLEFSPNGKGLYIMHEQNSYYTSPLSFYDITTQTLTDLNYTNISNFEKSQIEIAGDSANYTLWMASDHYLGGLHDPDVPASPPNPPAWNSSAVPLNNYSTNIGGPVGLSTQASITHIVPDQIDYEDYVEGIFFETCKCCEKYAYAGENKDTTYTALTSETWSYGLSSNPWHALAGDTIYIRDYLKIPAGKSITISGMYFKFGPEARVIVQRKQGSLNAASLTLTNGTVFTADFRCARRKYHCDDPDARCNNMEFWQGVRVEGDATDHTQSSTKQARFTMLNDAMIEYARIGILAGDETQSNYGGGIVSVLNSRLKDNETGVSFDPYARTSGSTELYTKSYIYKNTFSTTDEWVFPSVPKYFVYVDQSSGLFIKGNTFQNTNTVSNFADTQKGIGIKTSNSRVYASWACSDTPNPCPVPVSGVKRNKFIDLSYGIYGYNSSQNVRTLTCNYGLFQNNLYGIYLSSFIDPVILDNIFTLPDHYYTSIGLFMNASTGYAVQNNTFSTYGSGSTSGNYGIFIANSGAGGNEIYRNQFEKLMFGGYVQGKNTDTSSPQNGYADGLVWICNTFNQPITTADIALNGNMSDEQGDCNFRPADNLFSRSSTLYSNHKDLLAYNVTFPTATPIDYNHSYNTTAYPRLLPRKYSGQMGNPQYFQLTSCNINTNYDPENSCPVDLSGAPSLPIKGRGFESSGGNNLISYASLSESLANYSNQMAAMENQIDATDEDGELAQLKYAYQKLWHEAVRQYQNDTTGVISTDQMQALLSEYQPEEVSRFASILLPPSDQSWIAQDNLSAVEAFAGGVLPAETNGNLPTEIPAWFESDFFANASNASALNALYIADNAIYNPSIPEVATIQSGWDGNLSGNSDSQNNSQLIVQPNPFNETVHFNLSNYAIEGSQNRLEFYDITGVQLYSMQLAENQIQIDISGSNFPQGIILYTLYLNNIPIDNGKIVRVE